MVATRGQTFKRPWRRSCLSSKLKSSSAPIGRKDSWCFHAVGSSNAPLLGSTAAEGLPRIGRTSIATRWRSCDLPQSASCSENFVIPPDVFGQTLRLRTDKGVTPILIDTPSQSVRSSFQRAEPEPIRVSVSSLRSMSGERKYHASTCNSARRIAEASAARRSRRCRCNDVCWLLLGWLVARQHRLQDGKGALRAGGHSGAGTRVRRQIQSTA